MRQNAVIIYDRTELRKGALGLRLRTMCTLIEDKIVLKNVYRRPKSIAHKNLQICGAKVGG